MDAQAISDIVSFGNKVIPTTWMVSGGQMFPMEFAGSLPRMSYFFSISSCVLTF